MFQLSLKILLAALMFVNLAFTVPIEDPNSVSNKSKNMIISADVENITFNHETYKEDKHLKEGNQNVTVNLTDHQKTSSNEGASSTKTLPVTLQNNSNPIPPVLKKKDDNHTNQNVTKRPVEETTPINQVTEIKNASDLTGEQKDLTEVSVSPRDEEDVTTIVPVPLEATISSSSSSSPSSSSSSPPSLSTTTLKSINETITVNNATIKKEKSNEENPDSEHKENAENTTHQMNTSTTTVLINVTTETIESSSVTLKSTEVTTVVSSENDQVDVGISTAAVEKKESVVEQEVQSNIKSKTLSANEKDSNGSMPAGIIVLVTALAFAAAIVVGYISIVIWKQYLEHRYGRRELLVNELEFDTNDLRHFEL